MHVNKARGNREPACVDDLGAAGVQPAPCSRDRTVLHQQVETLVEVPGRVYHSAVLNQYLHLKAPLRLRDREPPS